MVKKFLFALSICLFLTSCGSKTNQENENQKNEISISNSENSKKEISKNLSSKDDKNPYQNIYDLLKGKKLVFFTGSYSEGVYFYKDGYFDGAFRVGDYNQGKVSLYNGKFDIKEKLDETSYLISLRRIDYELPLGESEMRNIEGMDFTLEYIESKMYGKDDKDNLYILYLPHRNLNDIKDHERSIAKINDEHIKDGELKVFAIGKKDASEENFMVEYVR